MENGIDEKNFKQITNTDELSIITTMKCKGKEYYLYSDSNLYEKLPDGRLVVLDRLNSENQKIIKKIMSKFKPGMTDVIRRKEKRRNQQSKEIKDIDVPEI